MLRLIGLVALLVVAVAGGYALAGGDPIGAGVDAAGDLAINDGSTAQVGGNFGDISINGSELDIVAKNEDGIANTTFHKFRVAAPDGWSAEQMEQGTKTYTFSRATPFPSGNYTVVAMRGGLDAEEIQNETVYLEQ